MNASRHPSLDQLALLSGGEMGLWSTFVLRRHTGRCPQCQTELAALQRASLMLRETSLTMPVGLDWNRLAGEMKANIRLGLAMGEIANSVTSRQPLEVDPRRWQAAAVAASLAFVLFSGWFLSRPHDFYRTLEPPVASVTYDGIGVAERGSPMTLLAPLAETATTSAEFGGGVQARYVNADSGQVTIHHVFTE
jgi:hypothetical protein